MRATKAGFALAFSAALTLAGCGSDNPKLLNLEANTDGPDEFAILPTKPLEMPESLAALPEPTPGGTNITDPTPKADAYMALGGRDPGPAGNPSASDGALVNYAARHGLSSDIRTTLASEDLEFRRANDGRLLERLFSVNVYFKAYRPMSLDRYAELERWRARGLMTPSAPPEDSAE